MARKSGLRASDHTIEAGSWQTRGKPADLAGVLDDGAWALTHSLRARPGPA